MLTEGVTLVEERRKRRRRMAWRKRRQASLGEIPSLSPALAQDPITGELLLCNDNTGDILRCNGTSTQTCIVEVNHSVLLNASPGRTSIGKCGRQPLDN